MNENYTKQYKPKKPLVIGIAGGTGSGKSSFTRALVSRFRYNASVLMHDNYYKEHHDMSIEERELINYDEPDAFDTELLCRHLECLERGQAVDMPVYDFTLHDRSEETVRIYPNKVIIVEGILVLESEELCSHFDIKIFVDTDADIRLIRRIRRDTKKRGRTLDSVLEQYEKTVKPMHEKYVEPSRRNADIILPDGGYNTVALDMLFSRIKRHIDSYYRNNRKDMKNFREKRINKDTVKEKTEQ